MKPKAGVVSTVLLSISSLFALSIAQRMELDGNYVYLTLYSDLHPTEICKSPENRTVFLNLSAVFTCETDGHFSGWEVNGTVARDLPPEVACNEGTTLLELTIPATAEYNDTRVQCVVVTLNGSSAVSETTILKVQGITYVSIA